MTYFRPQLPLPPKTPSVKKKKNIIDDRYRDACEVMEAVKKKTTTKSLAFGEHVNQKLLTYSQHVRNQVEYKISSILYEADMGFYNERNRTSASSPSVSSPYCQHNKYNFSASSPLSPESAPTPSPTLVYQSSNLMHSNTVNTLPETSLDTRAPTRYIEYAEAASNFMKNALQPQQESVLEYRVRNTEGKTTAVEYITND